MVEASGLDRGGGFDHVEVVAQVSGLLVLGEAAADGAEKVLRPPTRLGDGGLEALVEGLVRPGRLS